PPRQQFPFCHSTTAWRLDESKDNTPRHTGVTSGTRKKQGSSRQARSTVPPAGKTSHFAVDNPAGSAIISTNLLV
ncbi:MAG: hypothetical protein WD065_19070, partial [Planctomycetaceae bacterium]